MRSHLLCSVCVLEFWWRRFQCRMKHCGEAVSDGLSSHQPFCICPLQDIITSPLEKAAKNITSTVVNAGDKCGYGNVVPLVKEETLFKAGIYGASADSFYGNVENTSNMHEKGRLGMLDKTPSFLVPADRVPFGKVEVANTEKLAFTCSQLERIAYDESISSSAHILIETKPSVMADFEYQPTRVKSLYNSLHSDRAPLPVEKAYYISKEWGLSSLERKGSISSETPSMSATERLERTGSGGPNGLFQYSSLLRQSSGGSCTDSLIASDHPGASPNPSSNNLSDSTFLNSLYALDSLKHDEVEGGPSGTGGTGQDSYGDSSSEEGIRSWMRQTEQSYSLQMALALRLMAEAELTEEPRLLGSHFKEIGHASVCSSARKSVEATAHRYWVNGSLGYNDKVQDGFYQLWGVNPYVWDLCNHKEDSGRMPALESLRAVDPRDATFDVVVIDTIGDTRLLELKEKALDLALKAVDTKKLAEQLGNLVCSAMGGVAPAESGDLMHRWESGSRLLKNRLYSVVLPIGSLHVGLCRHRALLYKALADSVSLACRIARGCKFCDDDGASCLVLCESDREYLVNLISTPGELSDPEIPMSSSSAFSVASPLRLHKYSTIQITEEHREYCRELVRSSSLETSCSTSMLSGIASEAATAEEVARKKAAERTEQWLSPTLTPPTTSKMLVIPGTATTRSIDDTWISTMNNPLGESLPVPYNLELVAENEVLAHIDSSSSDKLRKTEVFQEALNWTLSDDSPGDSDCQAFDGEGGANWLVADPVKVISCSMIQEKNMEKSAAADWELKWEGDRVEPSKDEPSCSCFRYMNTGGSGHLSECSDGLGYHSGGSDVELAEALVEAVGEEWEIRWEDLALKEKIGAGSFGTVHRADWQGSDVAVKILMEQDVHDERIKEFTREVAIMRRLRHPNILLFMGAVSKRPNLSIITEYIPRGSLFRLLHRSGSMESMDERRRVRMALDVAKGMNYLHCSNPPIVHRDLKSPNLLVDKTWTVKVCDFGLSRFKGHTYLTSKSGAGTPEWMAPEVLRDEPANEKSDVYSFGVVLWELITMQKPWTGLSPVQVVGAVGFQNRRLLIPEDMNREIAEIIQSCWSNDASERPSFLRLMELLKPLQKMQVAVPL